jgi:hypothetical protein
MWSIHHIVVGTPHIDPTANGFSATYADLPAAPVAREVEVKVITVEAVRIGPQDGRKRPAGATVYRAKKRTLGNVAIPTREHGNLPTIRQPEGGNVKGIGQAMLRKCAPRDAVPRPA